jgi:hypothetical protein
MYLRSIQEVHIGSEIHQTFLDLTQAFDRLEFWASDLAIKRMNYPQKFTNLG